MDIGIRHWLRALYASGFAQAFGMSGVVTATLELFCARSPQSS